MLFVLNVDDAPLVLSRLNLLAIDVGRFLTTYHSKWQDLVDGVIQCTLIVFELIAVVGVHAQSVSIEFLSHAVLEGHAFAIVSSA